MPKTPESSPITIFLQTSNATRPLQVYTRRTTPIIQLVQVLESDLIPKTVVDDTVLEKQNITPCWEYFRGAEYIHRCWGSSNCNK